MKTLFLISALTLLSSTFAQASEMITLVKNDEAEVLVADTFGRTLYVFDIDLGSNSSKCNADCAEVWPPYIVTADEAAALKAPLATVSRANKKLQLTYEGRPVYTYTLDRELGGDKGDGLGGVWHYIEME